MPVSTPAPSPSPARATSAQLLVVGGSVTLFVCVPLFFDFLATFFHSFFSCETGGSGVGEPALPTCGCLGLTGVASDDSERSRFCNSV